MAMKEILLVDERAPITATIGFILQRRGYLVMLAPDARTAAAEVGNYSFDLLLVCLSGREADKVNLLRQVQRKSPQPKVMLVGNPLQAAWPTEVFRFDVYDYLFTPLTAPELCRRVARCMEDGRSAARQRTPGLKDTSNAGVLEALRERIRDLHTTLFSLTKQFSLFLQHPDASFTDYHLARIRAISRDLGTLTYITEEFFSSLLPGGTEERAHYPTGYFSRYDH
jgi:DNA-binding NtrC family response regulator